MIYPLPRHADGRKASISDHFHSAADVKAGRAKRRHRGCDLMYWRPLLQRRGVRHPYQSAGYEVPPPAELGGYDVPVLATELALVMLVQKLTTGWAVALRLEGGAGIVYHHVRGPMVSPGAFVPEGAPVAYVGGSPIGYGLWHLHLDRYPKVTAWVFDDLGRLGGGEEDPAPYLKGGRSLTLEEAWGGVGRTLAA